ncbi:MAG: hypothetical protein M4579_003133 [Chaenotheca gracillima]|nr:MAG: hypothetical protein M4579_003133 [Chaenotheca gracillima]
MSFLRRRIPGLTPSSSTSASRDTSPEKEKEKVHDVKSKGATTKHGQKSTSKKGRKRRHGLVFGLGGIFGIVVAAFFAERHDVINFEALSDMNLDSLFDVIPAGILKDAREIQAQERQAVNYDSFSIGLHLLSQGVRAQHPVIMIPGVISTGLESWGTDEKSQQYFRKRLWGSWSMMRALVLDKASWKKHIMLDMKTGLDPPGIKLRAAQGFDAADFFVTGYWIWNKILENLASIGYDPTNSYTAAYDWRLSYSNLEIRDQYFSRLKAYIETSSRISGKKTVLVSHSMGSQVLFYFFHWVESSSHGGGGPRWVEDHIDSWINISGCMLGASKGLPAVLSGEMKDTAQLNAFAVYGLEKFLSREERTEIFRAMPGISSMLPKGGDAVWGNETWAPDNRPNQNFNYGTFVNFRESNSTHTPRNLTVGSSLEYLLENSDTEYRDFILSNYSHGVAHSKEQVEINNHDPIKWINPLETSLPHAPSLKIYCFYGINKPTERGYFYREDQDPSSKLNVTIDTGVSSPAGVSGGSNVTIDHGIVNGEGDGTVPLLSNGYMCARGWRSIRRYNPAGAKVTTFEMPHEPDRFSPRGGPNTGDHVDILGRASLNDLILRIAGGQGHLIDDHIVSDILTYAERVKIYDEDESGAI